MTQATTPRRIGVRAALAVALIVALAAAAYGRTFATLWGTWLSNPNYSHGHLIPPVTAFLLWLERRRFAESVGPGTAWGLPLIVAALAAHLLSIRAGVFMTQGYSFVLLLFGLALFFFGGRATRAVWFGIGYLVFMLPMPPFLMNVVSFNLKLLAARTGSAVAARLGIPLVRSGVTIHMPAGSLRIADPCSGLHSLIALVALGALFAYLTKGPLWKRLVLFASAVPLAVLANIVRISVLCAVANVWGVDAAVGFFHDFSGLLLFVIAFAGLAVVRALLRFEGARKEAA
ncbi:MAG: exosortase/archaeosortase family protein [Candidatus Eisenbacteria bacterium]|nr:exosortase/archaeosortase family protein [Chloroflexota bacterium]MBM3307528.1 exosortase/archaeosortase family protein [Candidatus Eisenbacteria bacterium]